MAEVTAVGTYIRFWLPHVAQWIPGLLTLVILLLVNLISVGLFGEAEFWFALIKVVAIIALITIGIVLIGTSYKTPSGHASLANLVNYGGFFPKGASGFFMAFQMAIRLQDTCNAIANGLVLIGHSQLATRLVNHTMRNIANQ